MNQNHLSRAEYRNTRATLQKRDLFIFLRKFHEWIWTGRRVSSRDVTVRVSLLVMLSYGVPLMSSAKQFMGNPESNQKHLDAKSNNSNKSLQNQKTDFSKKKKIIIIFFQDRTANLKSRNSPSLLYRGNCRCSIASMNLNKWQEQVSSCEKVSLESSLESVEKRIEATGH